MKEKKPPVVSAELILVEPVNNSQIPAHPGNFEVLGTTNLASTEEITVELIRTADNSLIASANCFPIDDAWTATIAVPTGHTGGGYHVSAKYTGLGNPPRSAVTIAGAGQQFAISSPPAGGFLGTECSATGSCNAGDSITVRYDSPQGNQGPISASVDDAAGTWEAYFPQPLPVGANGTISVSCNGGPAVSVGQLTVVSVGNVDYPEEGEVYPPLPRAAPLVDHDFSGTLNQPFANCVVYVAAKRSGKHEKPPKKVQLNAQRQWKIKAKKVVGDIAGGLKLHFHFTVFDPQAQRWYYCCSGRFKTR